jgi:hypothetical protein
MATILPLKLDKALCLAKQIVCPDFDRDICFKSVKLQPPKLVQILFFAGLN